MPFRFIHCEWRYLYKKKKSEFVKSVTVGWNLTFQRGWFWWQLNYCWAERETSAVGFKHAMMRVWWMPSKDKSIHFHPIRRHLFLLRVTNIENLNAPSFFFFTPNPSDLHLVTLCVNTKVHRPIIIVAFTSSPAVTPPDWGSRGSAHLT